MSPAVRIWNNGTPSEGWSGPAVALDCGLLAVVAVAGVLTAGTLITDARISSRVLWQSAALAWFIGWCLASLRTKMRRELSLTKEGRRSRLPTLLFVAALVWTASEAARSVIRAGDGLVARYYANTEWTGSPVYSGNSAVPSTAQLTAHWSGDAPASFSVRWSGYLTVRRAGLYHLATTSDDASWLYVDNQLVVDNGGVHGPQTRAGEIQLAEGPHRVRLDYVQFSGESALTWSWAAADGPDRPVPPWLLSSERASNTAVVAVRVFHLGIQGLASAIVLASAWYVGIGLVPVLSATANAIALGLLDRSKAALVFSLFAYATLLFLPKGGWGLFDAIVGTIRQVNGSVVAMGRRFNAFEADINTPQAGEQRVLPERVLAMVAMLERHRLSRYQLSVSIAADDWTLQQMVASAWPRKREPDANAWFVLDGDEVLPSCAVIDREKGVSLVFCP